MTVEQKGILAKTLEAVGIAAVMIGLIQGTFGNDMWGELYLFLGGIAVFFIGRQIEKRLARKSASTQVNQ